MNERYHYHRIWNLKNLYSRLRLKFSRRSSIKDLINKNTDFTITQIRNGCADNFNHLHIHCVSITKRTKSCVVVDCAIMLKERITARTAVFNA